MVRFMAMILPAVISVSFLEHMEKKEYTVFQFLKTTGRYIFWINGVTLLICHYVMKMEASVYDSFASNSFLIHYLEISFLFTLIFPILSYRLRPIISISIKKRDA